MKTKRSLIGLPIALALSARLVAQTPPTCVGPGAQFGILAYHCASCGMKTENGITTYTFDSEPVVTEIMSWSPLQLGDVIEAVDGQPITTRAGAEAFSAALPFAWLARVNDSVRAAIKAGGVPDTTSPAWRADSLQKVRLMLLRQAYLKRVLQDSTFRMSLPKPIRVRRNGESLTLTAPAGQCRAGGRGGRVGGGGDVGAFGFALSCDSSCVSVRRADGAEYVRFAAPPIVALVRPGSPADRIQLRVGDRIMEVGGLSILDEQGARRLSDAERQRKLAITILRDGEEHRYNMSLP